MRSTLLLLAGSLLLPTFAQAQEQKGDPPQQAPKPPTIAVPT
jgi:hypothetical protein